MPTTTATCRSWRRGQLLTADNQIDTTTGTAKLKAVFDNENEALFPNQFVNIHLVMENRPTALVVPSAAIQSGLQGTFVWVIDTDAKGARTAVIQPVKVALAEGQVTILDSGVSPGENVVVDGADRLRQGAPVVVSQTRQRTGNGGAAGCSTRLRIRCEQCRRSDPGWRGSGGRRERQGTR